jgi:thioredoxin reductase
MGSESQRYVLARRIAIIGAGSAGIAAAKYLQKRNVKLPGLDLTHLFRYFKAEKTFEAVDVYEQRSNPGGLWNHSVSSTKDGLFQVPNENPITPPEKPVEASDVFVSPVYDSLEVNIPHPIMAYSGFPFREGIPLFPGHAEVIRYLENYSKDVMDIIQFSTQIDEVCFVEETKTSNGSITAMWKVNGVNLPSKERFTRDYDAVVVANGHYAVPFIPNIPGLGVWASRFPGSIIHSKYYRTPDHYMDKRVIVVGSSASGLDIASHLTEVCSLPVYQSQKSVSDFARGFLDNSKIKIVGQIASVIPDQRKVMLMDGTEIEAVDTIVFCTGYLYSFPFFHNLKPSPIVEGAMVHGTYLHLLYTAHPSLCFLALPKKIIPFPVAEAQAAVVARIYSGRLALPLTAIMKAWESGQMIKTATPDRFHVFDSLQDGKYINYMIDWALKATKRDQLENEGQGKIPEKWGPEQFWIRGNIGIMRRALWSRGEARHQIRTFEELGVEYEAIDN